MKTRAAVAVDKAKPLEIMEVDLEGPKAGEVLVEIKATGICHTDEFTLSGADPEGLFPSILGHEGAGIVVDVGPGVTSVRKGDHVIPLYTPECRQCPSCLSRKTNLCTAIRATQGQGVMPDGSSRFSLGGKKLFHYMGTSTFSNFTVLPEIAVAKVREDAPFDKICYIGCGVTTGVGAVLNTAKVEPGAKAIVFGLGGIGLNVIQGLKLAGADMIIGVDINNDKKAWGERFGMTHFVNANEAGKDLVAHLVNMTKKGADQIGGADYTFDCTGNVTVMRQALEACHRGWGVSVIIGVAGGRAGDRHATLPARHGARLEGHRLRRRARPHGCAEDRRLVHGEEDRDRPDDHPHHAARRHQQGLRPHARRQEHPQRGAVLSKVQARAWRTDEPRMKRILKWIGNGLAGVVVLALVAAGAGYALLRNTVPSASGSLALAGLSAPVEVVRDKEGVPHIFAESMGDLFAALGFLHAQDRLWQMELTRRTGQGRLSEIFGERTYTTDVFLRTLDLYGHAERALEVLPPAARWNLEAYARGVNAYLTRQTGWLEPRLPPEFLILRHKPEPWRPADSVVAVKLMALNLSTNLGFEMMRLELAAQGLGSAEIEDLMPHDADVPTPPLPEIAQLYPLRRPAAPQRQAHAAHSDIDDIVGGGASNNWVVSGARTRSGKPLLANDPHLRLAAPSIWYLAHLALQPRDGSSPANSVGATLAGVPLIVLGRGDTLAWGFTNTGPDVQDLFIEKINPDNPREYLRPRAGSRSTSTR